MIFKSVFLVREEKKKINCNHCDRAKCQQVFGLSKILQCNLFKKVAEQKDRGCVHLSEHAQLPCEQFWNTDNNHNILCT